MSEYPKKARITFLNRQIMKLDDNSAHQLLPHMLPSGWRVGDDVLVDTMEGPISKGLMLKVKNKTRETPDISVISLKSEGNQENWPDLNKSLKSPKQYPQDRLNRVWRIIKLLEGGRILLEDRSIWQLMNFSNKGMGEWNEGQYVRINKTGGIGYKMENLDLDIEREPFTASFEEFLE